MYGLLAFLTVATMGLSNSSLGYLNYPTQVIFKCCKLIPVLIGGIIIQGVLNFCCVRIEDVQLHGILSSGFNWLCNNRFSLRMDLFQKFTKTAIWSLDVIPMQSSHSDYDVFFKCILMAVFICCRESFQATGFHRLSLYECGTDIFYTGRQSSISKLQYLW